MTLTYFHLQDRKEMFQFFDEDSNGTLDMRELGKLNAAIFNIFPRFGYKGTEPPGRMNLHLSRSTRKPAICLCSNCTADRCLCFRHTDSTIPLLLISKVSSLQLYSVTVQPGLCQTWSEPKLLVFLCTGS